MKIAIISKKLFSNFCFSFTRCHFNIRSMFQIPKVYVRQFDTEETMKITFLYGSADFPTQNFTFMRNKSESLEAALTRMKNKIQASLLQKSNKKRKKSTVDVDQVLPPLNIELVKNGVKVSENTKNIEAWSSETEMVINDMRYKVILNPPTITQISLPKNIMHGFPIYPRVTLEFSNKDYCIFKWYRNVLKCDKDKLEKDENLIKVKNVNWKFIFQGYMYITQNEDIGHKLRVSCIPQSENGFGMEEDAVSPNDVFPGPGKCPFEDRHEYTKELAKCGSFRCISYNILADLYADTDTARNELFPYCPPEYLDVDYRKQLYLKEIMGYNADIICLQEVDRKIFQDDLHPLLESVGLKGVFNEKGGQVAEGLSCFYRDSKFKLQKSWSIILSDAIKSEPVLGKLYSKISENEKLLERFISRTTALQVTLFESIDVPNKRIFIGNTHLYFHPVSDNIRLLQAATCITYLEDVLKKYQNENPQYSVNLVLAGDFNSCPENGVYTLATERFLPGTADDWKSNPEEFVEGIDLSHSLELDSACGTPEYTNFTETTETSESGLESFKGFKGCLDYIFYDKSALEVTQVVSLPSHNQVIEYKALPNKVFPSDHLALVCTLSWK